VVSVCTVAFLKVPCDKLTKSFGMQYSTSYASPGLTMREYLLTAPGILVIWRVTHPGTNRAQHCLTSVIKWVPVCPRWQDAVLMSYTYLHLEVCATHIYSYSLIMNNCIELNCFSCIRLSLPFSQLLCL
jgi:hypothetical protein